VRPPAGRLILSTGARRATSPPSEVRREAPRTSFFYLFPRLERTDVAKTSPGEFIRQVRAETAKVVWPTRKETMTTAIMVLIMTTLLAIFFFGVDSFFAAIVKFLLDLLA
jgi:preprotein translocase subunit SecE